jgi:cytidyltransferase-like protein
LAVWAGMFDPITNGHLDIAVRATRLFDKLIIGIVDTTGRRILFTMLCLIIERTKAERIRSGQYFFDIIGNTGA